MFTGREYDTETANYYYRARYYSPKLGRFLQTDPIGYEGGLVLYTYCRNNPINWVDPWGRISSLENPETPAVIEMLNGDAAANAAGDFVIHNTTKLPWWKQAIGWIFGLLAMNSNCHDEQPTMLPLPPPKPGPQSIQPNPAYPMPETVPNPNSLVPNPEDKLPKPDDFLPNKDELMQDVIDQMKEYDALGWDKQCLENLRNRIEAIP